MAAAFIQAINGLTVRSSPLQPFTSQNSFAEFFSSSFPIFSLGSEVDKPELEKASKIIHEQAQRELGFEDSELAEMGYATKVPVAWQLEDKPAADIVEWYHEEFDKCGSRSADDPKWYPLGFIGLVSGNWRETGVVLVFYDAKHEQLETLPVRVKAFIVDPDKIGPALISLRQGDDDFENIMRCHRLS